MWVMLKWVAKEHKDAHPDDVAELAVGGPIPLWQPQFRKVIELETKAKDAFDLGTEAREEELIRLQTEAENLNESARPLRTLHVSASAAKVVASDMIVIC